MKHPFTHGIIRINALALALVALLWFGLAHEVFSAQVYYGISVTTTQDRFDTTATGAGCSLREAIQTFSSNFNNGRCLRVFGTDRPSIYLPSGTYTLTIAGANEDLNASGDLDVRGNILISATGPTRPIVTANPGWDDRIFAIISGTVRMQGIEIRGGYVLPNSDYAGGGALWVHNGAALSLKDSVVANNVAGGIGLDGGGIYNLGTLALTDVTVSGNLSTRDGGGIFNLGTLTLDNVSFIGNSSGRDGGGIRNNGAMTLSNSTLS